MSPRWWQWPTVLSLDAPIVSVVWQINIARAVASPLDGARMFVLGASVWLAYVADRWIEAQRLDSRDIQTPRHHFYCRHRALTAGAWVVVLATDLFVAMTRLTRVELGRGVVLLAAVLAYVLSHQYLHRKRRWRAPKEFLIAGLLTGGIAIFLAGTAPVFSLLTALTCFALLCFTNCALISAWERDVDIAQDQESLALQAPAFVAAIRALPWLVAIVAATVAVTGHVPVIGYCAAVSAVLMGLIDRNEQRLGWPLARVLVDAVLLTPLAVLWPI